MGADAAEFMNRLYINSWSGLGVSRSRYGILCRDDDAVFAGEHLLLDVPSADRADDGGHLSAHREFFGLPGGSTSLAEVRRPHCTITELVYVEDRVADGAYLLSLQIPALGGDAVPSRPLLYPVRPA